IVVNTTTPVLPFTVFDVDTAPEALIVTATSSNPVLVPNSNIFLAGSGANRTVLVSPTPNQVGSATITLTVFDGENLTGSTSFIVAVVSGGLFCSTFNAFDPFLPPAGSFLNG